ncbi:MAG: HAMP domain-containing histidine kinase [Bacteroides sp.]|nr:HAMP domain-containing histidine kinase [Bacteroides sp.]MCM1550950.1 HAMP domain-containing histidine kinase [Clostridium sp.]
MHPTLLIKRTIRIAALGIILTAAIGAFGFFGYMVQEFGIRDLSCRQFPETRRFAAELADMLYSLEMEASYLRGYEAEIPNTSLILHNIYCKMPEGCLAWEGLEKNVKLQYLLTYFEDGYEAYADEYGIQVINAGGYYDAWYDITLSARQIQTVSEYTMMSHDDYVNLVMSHARLNSLEAVQNIEIDTAYFSIGYVDEEFSENSYIGYYDEFMYVYSPDEDMFYSSLYGWYAVPDILFFPTEDIQDCDGIDLLRHRFASREEILRQKIGSDYLEYVRAELDMQYNQRNVVYYVYTEEGSLYTNAGTLNKLENCNLRLCIEPTESGEYTVEFFNFNNEYLNDEYVTGIMQNMDILRPREKLYIGIYTTYPYFDIFSEKNQLFNSYYPYTMPAFIIAGILMISAVVLTIQIFRDCGYASKTDRNVYLNVMDKLPIEFMAGIVIFSLWILASDVYGELRYNISLLYTTYYKSAIRLFGVFFFCYFLGITAILSIVRRGKARKLIDYSLIRWTWIGLKRLAYSISQQKNLMARAVELFVLYWLFMVLGCVAVILGMGGENYIVIFLGILIIGILNISVLILLLRQAKGEQSIRDATKALADGDLEYQSSVIKRLGTEQEIIDNINHLSDGLHKAVEKSIYDERLKAELITNVSHDIKTPLTSIINYVGLIKQEDIENEKVLHYIEVLDKKSQRLKQLTEDLVEVSKITSGNIELERVPIDFTELLRQSIGEFEDKFGERELQLMDNIPDHSYMIFADGRRTFRILENLFQNIYKYAMPKTRVYIDLTNEKEQVIFSVKNISMAPLNIRADELMERFVRGDQSRTTEGSGLGLSIARDLVKMQDGEFQIYLDGDLFKVMISFPEFLSDEVIDMEEGEEALEADIKKAIEKNN